MRVPAILALSALTLAAGCGDDDDDSGVVRSAPTTQTAPPAEPQPAPSPQGVPQGERPGAVRTASRYIDALGRADLARACALLSPAARADEAEGGCEAELGAYVARQQARLRLARTVPVWQSGRLDAGTGALIARVKIGFPAKPEIRWVVRLRKEPGGRWRIDEPFAAEELAGY